MITPPQLAGLTAAPTTGIDASTSGISAERQELREAAQGFEAIMIRKMLESARASSFAEDTPLAGGGKQQFEKMLDEHYADVASASGVFGFARSIEEQLAQYVDGKAVQP